MDHDQTLFDRLGGIRPMAAWLQKAPTTVQYWKDTGRIPPNVQRDILAKARKEGIKIRPEDVIFPLGSFQRQERAA